MKIHKVPLKHLLLFFTTAFLGLNITYSQKETNYTIKKDTLNQKKRKALFNKEFTSSLSDNPNNYIGNYASINTSTTTASFATSFVRQGSVFGFNVSGGTSDKTLRFINNNDLNYNLTIGAQYHFMDTSKKVSLIIDKREKDTYILAEAAIKKEAQKKIDAIKNEEEIKPLILKAKAVQKKIVELKGMLTHLNDTKKLIRKEKIEDQIKVIDLQLKDANEYNNGNRAYTNKKNAALARIKNCFTKECIEERVALNEDRIVLQILMQKKDLEKNRDSLDKEAKKITLISEPIRINDKINTLIDTIQKTKKEIEAYRTKKNYLIAVIGNQRAKDLKEHNKKGITTYGSSFNWFSIGARTTLNSFVLFDGTKPFEEQIDEKEGINYELTLQYSWHQRKELETWQSYLINLGTTITYGDNLQRLSQRTLEDTNTLENQNDVTRVTRSQTNVFVGDYMDDIAGMRLYADTYYFMFRGNFAALHLYPNVRLLEDQKPVFNTELGLVLSYKDKDKPSTLVSAELFYAFNDIGNSIESDSNFLERNTIGLRLTLPISFTYQP